MLVVPDSVRKFPIQKVQYLDLSVDDLFEYLLALKRANCPNWTDETASDLGIQILWMFSVLSDWMVRHIERVKNDSYIGTTNDREVMRRICELIGYSLSESTASSVTLTLTHSVPHDAFVIPAGTKFSTARVDNLMPIVFESVADVNVAIDQATSVVICTQGETTANKTIGSSSGKVNQEFLIGSSLVIWHTEKVEVNEGAGFLLWTRVEHFVDSLATDKHYRVEIQNESDYVVVFGDGTNGVVPQAGINNIRSTFRIGVGQLGNIVIGAINTIVDQIQDTTSVTNLSVASGGTDRESLDMARLRAPASLRSLDRAITLIDMESIAKNYKSTIYGSISQAKAISIGPEAVSLMIVPSSGGLPISGHRSELQTYLMARIVMGSIVQVIDPIYKIINITATVVIEDNASPTQVNNELMAKIVQFISPTFQDPSTGIFEHEFGRDIRLSDLYSLIDGTIGVKYVNISLPVADVIVSTNQIADIGTINLNITTSSTEFEFTSTKEDVMTFWRKERSSTPG